MKKFYGQRTKPNYLLPCPIHFLICPLSFNAKLLIRNPLLKAGSYALSSVRGIQYRFLIERDFGGIYVAFSRGTRFEYFRELAELL